MFKYFPKTLLFAVFSLLLAINYLETCARCNGVYPPTITRKILAEKVTFINDRNEYLKDLNGGGGTDIAVYLPYRRKQEIVICFVIFSSILVRY